jgi:CheY-like chemotaxis protein
LKILLLKMKKIKILVVEDSPDVLKYYECILQGAFIPFQEFLANNDVLVTYAKDYENARALVSEKFDVIFLDDELPKANIVCKCGYSLIPEFRQHANTIIIGTSSDKKMTAPYDEYFEKVPEESYENLCALVVRISKTL